MAGLLVAVAVVVKGSVEVCETSRSGLSVRVVADGSFVSCVAVLDVDLAEHLHISFGFGSDVGAD